MKFKHPKLEHVEVSYFPPHKTYVVSFKPLSGQVKHCFMVDLSVLLEEIKDKAPQIAQELGLVYAPGSVKEFDY